MGWLGPTPVSFPVSVYDGVIKIPRPPIPVTMPITYNVVSEIWAKYDCIVEYCPETMTREEICMKDEGSEYKVFHREWVDYETNMY